MTRRGADLRLFLDGDLQFSSLDEYRYHEALVHPAMAAHEAPRHVLLLGAGDGLALREILRWPSVERVDVVELDPVVIRLARQQPQLRRLNQDSLKDPRVIVHLGDAYAAVRNFKRRFDVVIADFPDPDTLPVARLYSVGFYGAVRERLRPGGVMVTQASAPFLTPRSGLDSGGTAAGRPGDASLQRSHPHLRSLGVRDGSAQCLVTSVPAHSISHTLDRFRSARGAVRIPQRFSAERLRYCASQPDDTAGSS